MNKEKESSAKEIALRRRRTCFELVTHFSPTNIPRSRRVEWHQEFGLCPKGAVMEILLYLGQYYTKKSLLKREIAVRAPGGKYEMICPIKNKLESVFSDFSNFQVAIHFHPGRSQTKLINVSFCALVGFLLTKLNHYFNVSIDTSMFFRYSK